jgi:menaquinone-dependent protoporphyrinogen IX oxidase
MNVMQREERMAKPQVLVVYYSRSGTTRRIAQALAAMLGGTLEEIAETKSRASLLGYWRSVIEARRQLPATIVAAKTDPSSFDLVVIGTPVWAWSLSSPVRAYLAASRGSLPEVAFFCTLGGAGASTTFTQMQGIVGKPPRATCALTARDIEAGREGPLLAGFVATLLARTTTAAA